MNPKAFTWSTLSASLWGAARRGSLTRQIITNHVLDYWRNHIHSTPHEAALIGHVQENASIRPGARTIHQVLRWLVQEGVLLAGRANRNLVYNLNPAHADPTWPGSTAQVDALLLDPIWWATPDGRFWRVGRPNPPNRRMLEVPTGPGCLAQFAWMRGCIHAFDTGLLGQPAGMETLVHAVREAPVQALLSAHGRECFGSSASLPGADRFVAELEWLLSNRRRIEREASVTGRWLGDRPERSLGMLAQKAVVGHVAAALETSIVRGIRGPSSANSPASVDAPEFPPDPVLQRVEPILRSSSEPFRGLLSRHQVAWPRGVFFAES